MEEDVKRKLLKLIIDTKNEFDNSEKKFIIEYLQ